MNKEELKKLILETYSGMSNSLTNEVERIKDEMEIEWYEGQRHQTWKLVPARDLLIVWSTFVKYGRVDESKLNKIWETLKKSVIKVLINSDITNGEEPEFFGKERYDEITEDDWKRWSEFIGDNSGNELKRHSLEFGVNGNMRHSDCARSLFVLLKNVDRADNEESKLLEIDRIINFIHGLGSMAHWFIEGGEATLDKIRDMTVKGIHLQGKLSEGWNSNIWPSNIWKSNIWKSNIWPSHIWEDENVENGKPAENKSVREKAAKMYIYTVWRKMPVADKFSFYQLSLWGDNEREISDLKAKIAKSLYPNDEDECGTFMSNDVEPMLEKLEDAMYKKKASKIDASDPLFILKSIVRDKTFAGAKQSLYKAYLAAWSYKGGKVSDEIANQVFERMYKHAMGETAYDETVINRTTRLSDLKQPSADASEQIFVQQYSGYKSPKFPDVVKVYRGTNSPTNVIKAGDFVTFDRDFAYYGFGRGKFKAVIRAELPSKDLRVYKMDVDSSEMVYWPDNHQIKKYTGEIPTFKQFWYEVNNKM